VEIDGAAGGLTIGPSRSGSIAPPKQGPEMPERKHAGDEPTPYLIAAR